MSRPLSITIVNDYDVVILGLRRMLEPYADRVHVVELAAGELPTEDSDIALYDAFGAPADLAADCAESLASHRAERLVLYTWNVEAALADPALSDTASGVISKTATAAELVELLEEVHAGETVRVRQGANNGTPDGAWPGQAQGLAERESEILALIVQGLSNQDIADQLYLSINTVKSYIRTAYRRMPAVNRTQAILWGVDHGFRPDRARTSAD